MFIIEDEKHAAPHAQFATFKEAVEELKRLAEIPWNEPPNRAPCKGWQTCGRSYEIVEYDDRQTPWNELRRVLVMEISAAGVNWEKGYPDNYVLL